MTCPHRTISLRENGLHVCCDCGTPVGILDGRVRGYLRAIDTLVYTARRFAAVARHRRKDLYKQSFNSLEVAARSLDAWYDEPVLPAPRRPGTTTHDSRELRKVAA